MRGFRRTNASERWSFGAASRARPIRAVHPSYFARSLFLTDYDRGRRPAPQTATLSRVEFFTMYIASSARCKSSAFVRESPG
jgi:hypothetical protein